MGAGHTTQPANATPSQKPAHHAHAAFHTKRVVAGAEVRVFNHGVLGAVHVDAVSVWRVAWVQHRHAVDVQVSHRRHVQRPVGGIGERVVAQRRVGDV